LTKGKKTRQRKRTETGLAKVDKPEERQELTRLADRVRELPPGVIGLSTGFLDYPVVPPVLSYEHLERFPFVYGFDVASNEVNVFTLTPALEAFAKAVN
jgi:hypothetical protein